MGRIRAIKLPLNIMMLPLRRSLALAALSLSLVSPLVLAQSYSLPDLQALIARKEFSEAVMHLRDIAPVARDAAWDDVAVKALIGHADTISKDGAGEAYRYLEEGTRAFPSTAGDARMKSKQVELGIVAMKERRFYSRNERDKIAETILQMDASVIVPLVTESFYDDPKQRLYAWIEQNPQAANGNPRLKDYVLRRAGQKTVSETPAQSQAKFAAMKKVGWIDEWAKADQARVATYASELMRGQFNNQHVGRVLLTSLEEAGYRNDDLHVRFFAPLALMRSATTSVDPLEQIGKASPSSLKKAERELLQSKPETAFWFGGAWDAALWEKARKLLPEVAKLAEQECAAQRRDASKEPIHVSYGGCSWIK